MRFPTGENRMGISPLLQMGTILLEEPTGWSAALQCKYYRESLVRE